MTSTVRRPTTSSSLLGEEWTINEVDFFDALDRAAPLMLIHVRFYLNGAGDLPGGMLAERLYQTYIGGPTVMVTVDPPVDLTPGTYWVGIQGRLVDYNKPEQHLVYWVTRTRLSYAWALPGTNRATAGKAAARPSAPPGLHTRVPRPRPGLPPARNNRATAPTTTTSASTASTATAPTTTTSASTAPITATASTSHRLHPSHRLHRHRRHRRRHCHPPPVSSRESSGYGFQPRSGRSGSGIARSAASAVLAQGESVA